ncbi:MAG TPA: hypothetical protein VM531_11135 [Sphingomicrobium sp.]|jgi:hypothetical protein|nr:hypothetical protein [Sphingomicrobium sp.]
MAITRLNPNTIFLGGERTQVGDLACSEAITPGMLVEEFNNGGIIRWRKATADIAGPPAIATEHAMANRGVDDNYIASDLLEVSIGHKGATFWGLIASGQNIAAGALLGSAGGGTLKSGATVARFTALENKPSVTVLTRIRVEVL